MAVQSFTVDLLGKSGGAAPGTSRKKEASNSGSYPSFIDTLNSKVDKNYARKSYPSIQKKYGLNLGKESDKKAYNINESEAKAEASRSDNRIKRYKDAVRENEKTSAEKYEKSKDSKKVCKDENINKTDEKKTEKTEAEVVVESLAQILNISVDELKQLMSTLNISPKDLADESKTTEIAGKILGLFGLDSEQKAAFLKLAQFTISKAKSVVSGMETQDNELVQDKKADWVKLEGVDIEVVEIDKKVQLQDAVQLGNKIKEILTQLENKLETEPEKLFGDLSKKVEEIAAGDLKAIKANAFEETQTIEASELENTEDSKVDKASESKEESSTSENNEDNTSDQKAEGIDLKKTSTENTLKSNIQDADQSQFDITLNNQQIKTNGASELPKVQKEVEVSKKEIISQIVEKAKVVLTDEKSEMVIDLKPDHLGKLSLKVVTERGSVVAKFIAESEQVKAAIESNMDNLKESLTKQGFSIQGFSVSVEQESRKGFNEGYGLSKNSRGKGEKVISTATVGVSAIEENQQKLNPYMVNNSSIDLTA